MSPDPAVALEWLGAAVVVASAAALLLARRGLAVALGGAGFALVVSFIVPASHGSLFTAAVAVLGAPGAASLVLLPAIALAEITGSTALVAQCRIVATALLLLAAALYPMALGLGACDPYRFGYSGPALPLIIIALLALAWFRQAPLAAVWLGAAAALHLSGVHPSLNLWDHLIDPVATIAAVAILVHALVVGRRTAPRVTDL